jgi:NAD+ synthase (glutamine-hydrolysing)
MLYLTIAQLNPTVGDIEGNTNKIIAAARSANERTQLSVGPSGAHLVVFPELCVTGYYPGDLFDEPDFMPRVVQALDYIRHTSRELPNLYWVIGAPVAHGKPGKGLHNTLLVYQAGELRLEYCKQLLPTYNIFDEQRHFDAGPDVARVLRIGATQVGFLICEDGWNDGEDEYRSIACVMLPQTCSCRSMPAPRASAGARHGIRCLRLPASAMVCPSCT